MLNRETYAANSWHTIDEQSRADLRNELVETECLLSALGSTLRSRWMGTHLFASILPLESQCGSYIEILRETLTNGCGAVTLRDIARLRVQFHYQCRQLHRLAGALQTLENWQSPVFLASGEIPAGRHHPHLSERGFDYSRDRHIDAEEYERLFLSELLPLPPGESYAWLTSSGMSAILLAIDHIRSRLPAGARVLARGDMYHETRELLSHWFGSNIDWLPDDSSDIVSPLRSGPYGALFLDAHTNATRLRCPAVLPVLEYISAQGDHAPYCLCDTTALPFAAAEWLSKSPPMPPGKVFFAESLIKFHQFGLDATNAGILLGIGHCPANDDLWYLRAHLGVNISDTAAATLPRPNRIALYSRLCRMQRNARIIGDALAPLADIAGGSRLGHAVSPTLDGHPDHLILRSLPFQGAIVSIELPRALHTPEALYLLSREVIRAAASRDVVLHGGSSFGFSTTRVYVTAATTRFGRPFLRIAAGSESFGEASAIATAIYEAASELP